MLFTVTESLVSVKQHVRKVENGQGDKTWSFCVLSNVHLCDLAVNQTGIHLTVSFGMYSVNFACGPL